MTLTRDGRIRRSDQTRLSALRSQYIASSALDCWSRRTSVPRVRAAADRGLQIERQKPLPLMYRGQRLDIGYRLDLWSKSWSSSK